MGVPGAFWKKLKKKSVKFGLGGRSNISLPRIGGSHPVPSLSLLSTERRGTAMYYLCIDRISKIPRRTNLRARTSHRASSLLPSSLKLPSFKAKFTKLHKKTRHSFNISICGICQRGFEDKVLNKINCCKGITLVPPQISFHIRHIIIGVMYINKNDRLTSNQLGYMELGE